MHKTVWINQPIYNHKTNMNTGLTERGHYLVESGHYLTGRGCCLVGFGGNLAVTVCLATAGKGRFRQRECRRIKAFAHRISAGKYPPAGRRYLDSPAVRRSARGHCRPARRQGVAA